MLPDSVNPASPPADLPWPRLLASAGEAEGGHTGEPAGVHRFVPAVHLAKHQDCAHGPPAQHGKCLLGGHWVAVLQQLKRSMAATWKQLRNAARPMFGTAAAQAQPPCDVPPTPHFTCLLHPPMLCLACLQRVSVTAANREYKTMAARRGISFLSCGQVC